MLPRPGSCCTSARTPRSAHFAPHVAATAQQPEAYVWTVDALNARRTGSRGSARGSARGADGCPAGARRRGGVAGDGAGDHVVRLPVRRRRLRAVRGPTARPRRHACRSSPLGPPAEVGDLVGLHADARHRAARPAGARGRTSPRSSRPASSSPRSGWATPASARPARSRPAADGRSGSRRGQDGRVLLHDDVIAEYRDFATYAAGDSPCFEAWALGVTEDPEVLAWLATLPPIKRQPNLVLAAARWHGAPAPGPYAGLRRVLLEQEPRGPRHRHGACHADQRGRPAREPRPGDGARRGAAGARRGRRQRRAVPLPRPLRLRLAAARRAAGERG